MAAVGSRWLAEEPVTPSRRCVGDARVFGRHTWLRVGPGPGSASDPACKFSAAALIAGRMEHVHDSAFVLSFPRTRAVGGEMGVRGAMPAERLPTVDFFSRVIRFDEMPTTSVVVSVNFEATHYAKIGAGWWGLWNATGNF